MQTYLVIDTTRPMFPSLERGLIDARSPEMVTYRRQELLQRLTQPLSHLSCTSYGQSRMVWVQPSLTGRSRFGRGRGWLVGLGFTLGPRGDRTTAVGLSAMLCILTSVAAARCPASEHRLSSLPMSRAPPAVPNSTAENAANNICYL